MKKIFLFLIFSFINLLFVTKSNAVCQIFQTGSGAFSSRDKDYTITGYYLGPDCTDSDFLHYISKLPDEEKKQNFKNFISNMMDGHDYSRQSFANLKDFLLSALPTILSQSSASKLPFLSSTSVTFSASQFPGTHYSPEEFEKTFGVKFDKKNFGVFIAAGALGNLSRNLGITPSTSAEISLSLLAGYQVVQFIQSGNLMALTTEIGKSFALGFKTLVFGERLHDYVADAYEKANILAINKMYDDYKKALIDYAYEQSTNAYNLSIMSNISWNEINAEFASAQKIIDQIRTETYESQKKFEDYLTEIRTIVKNEKETYNKDDEELERLRKGYAKEELLKEKHDEIEKGLQKANANNPIAGVQSVSDYVDLANMWGADNPLVLNQFRNFLRDYIDDNGLIPQLVSLDEQVQNYQFKTNVFSTENSTQASLIRDGVNKSLAVKKYTNSITAYERAQQALNLLLAADQAYGKKDKYWGDFQLFTGLKLIAYETNDPAYIEDFKKTQLSNRAMEMFSTESFSADTFEKNMIMTVMNKFAESKLVRNDFATEITANLLVKQLEYQAENHNIQGFISDLKNIEAVLGSIATGAVNGLTQFVTDTVTGMITVATHPADTVVSLYNTLIHVSIYEHLNERVQTIIKDFPNYDVEEKSRIVSLISAEIVSTFLPVGKISKLEKYAELSKNFHLATEKLTEHTSAGLQGLRRAEQIEPRLSDLLNRTVTKKSWETGGSLELGLHLKDAKPEFIKNLVEYGLKNNIDIHEITAISRFQSGYTKFVSNVYHQDFIASGDFSVLGKDGKTYVLPTDVGDELVKRAHDMGSGGKQYLSEALGLEEKNWNYEKGQKLYRIDLPFTFDYKPNLPIGSEAGANSKFLGTGFTPGGAPEIIINNAPVNDIIGGQKSGYKVIYD